MGRWRISGNAGRSPKKKAPRQCWDHRGSLTNSPESEPKKPNLTLSFRALNHWLAPVVALKAQGRNSTIM